MSDFSFPYSSSDSSSGVASLDGLEPSSGPTPRDTSPITYGVSSPSEGRQPPRRTLRPPQKVHVDLWSCLQEPLKQVEGDQEAGCIYILRELEAPHYIKIGSAKHRRLKDRLREWASCDRKPVAIYTSKPFPLYKRAEQLICRDLMHLQRTLWCTRCSREHTECFEVDAGLAQHRAKIWINAMQKQPYDQSGRLKTIWQDKVFEKDLASEVLITDKGAGHMLRWSHWDKILDSMPWDDDQPWQLRSAGDRSIFSVGRAYDAVPSLRTQSLIGIGAFIVLGILSFFYRLRF